MSHFSNWRSTRLSKALMSHESGRVLRERKRENKKQEELSAEQGQMLQDQQSEDEAKGTGEDTAEEEGPALGKTEPRKDAKDWKLPVPLGPVHPPLMSSSLSTAKAVGRSWELSPPAAKSFRIQDAHVDLQSQQGPFRYFMDMKTDKKLASLKERRNRFRDINVHKRYQFGQVFSPFQALATTEMRRLVFPRELSMSSHMQRMGASCLGDVNLQDLPLSSTELSLGKDDNSREKEKPVSHIKTPLFPPIVKATKYNDTK